MQGTPSPLILEGELLYCFGGGRRHIVYGTTGDVPRVALLAHDSSKRKDSEGLVILRFAIYSVFSTRCTLRRQPSRVCGPRRQNASFRHGVIFGLGNWK